MKSILGQDKCQGTASAVPQKSQNNSFLAPQARAQRSGARKIIARGTYIAN
jgi:hypothetical protein